MEHISGDSNNPNDSKDEIKSPDKRFSLPVMIPTSSYDIDWENTPKKKKIRLWMTYMVCLISSVGILAYGVINKETTWYKERNKTNETKVIFYTKEDVVTYPVFFKVGLGLLGIILGVLVDRVSLVLEERDQLERRYNNSYQKLIKSCFSGISSGALISLTFIVIVSCIWGRKAPFKVTDCIYVVGGIGVVPFFVQLLNLNRPSKVVVSRIIEKEQMYPGYILAWSYYFNTLKNELEYFNELLRARQSLKLKKLSCDRLILLLAPGTDITNIDDLISYDEKIEKAMEENKIPIYRFKISQEETQYFPMLYVTEPLVALRNMKRVERVIFVTETTYEDELKRFYKTLSEILEDAPDDECTKKALLVPVNIKIGQYRKLGNGGLVRTIMEKVDTLSASNNAGSSSGNQLKNKPKREIGKKRQRKQKRAIIERDCEADGFHLDDRLSTSPLLP